MKYGPIAFLAAFLALSGSWFTFVVKPQLQVGQMLPTNAVPSGAAYPVARSGLAQQGLQVYRANGCYHCHSQQITQEGALIEVLLREAGTNVPAVQAALNQIAPGLTNALEDLPKAVLTGVTKERADAAIKLLQTAGAQAGPWIVPTGPDQARGWGRRRTVAEDFLYDSPVMLGAQRVGPDLSNIGLRQPDLRWHLRHLYAPAAVVKGSVMPPYRYLFEKRKISRSPSPDALAGVRELGVEEGYELIPTPDALALAAYMVGLRADAPLYSAPFSVAAAAPPVETNAPASGGQTNVQKQ